jgi:hypothetical protein
MGSVFRFKLFMHTRVMGISSPFFLSIKVLVLNLFGGPLM